MEVTAIEQNTEKRIFKNEDSLRDLRNNIAEVVIQSPSRVRLTATPWTAAHQAPLSVGFSRQEFWSGLPFPSPGDPPDPGSIPTLQADSLPTELQGKPRTHTHTHTHTQSFFIVFSSMVYHRALTLVPCAIQCYFCAHSIYNRFHLLIPNSQSISPPLVLPLHNRKSVLYAEESVSIL